MTAGQPHAHHNDAVRLTTAQADRITRLYAQGAPTDHIALIARCTRARVLQVAQQHGWTLDGSGRLPRDQRPTITPGQPVPATGSGMGPLPTRTPLPPLPAMPARPARATRPGRPRTNTGSCARPDCDNAARTVGLCAKHYMRQRRAAS